MKDNFLLDLAYALAFTAILLLGHSLVTLYG